MHHGLPTLKLRTYFAMLTAGLPTPRERSRGHTSRALWPARSPSPPPIPFVDTSDPASTPSLHPSAPRFPELGPLTIFPTRARTTSHAFVQTRPITNDMRGRGGVTSPSGRYIARPLTDLSKPPGAPIRLEVVWANGGRVRRRAFLHVRPLGAGSSIPGSRWA